LRKIEAKFVQRLFNLGKIKILHPQKHPFSYGYGFSISLHSRCCGSWFTVKRCTKNTWLYLYK